MQAFKKYFMSVSEVLTVMSDFHARLPVNQYKTCRCLNPLDLFIEVDRLPTTQ